MQSKIHREEILLQCNDSTHKKCNQLLDTVMDNFKNVLSAYVTYMEFENEIYCISAHAIVKNAETEKFEEELKQLENSKNGTGVVKSRIFICQDD